MKKKEWVNFTDEQLIKKFLKIKNEEIFKELYERYNKRIYNYMKKVLYYSSDFIIEELVNDVFVKVYLNIESLKKILSFKSWVYKIAHNICVNYIKSSKPEQQIIEDTVIDKNIDLEKDIIAAEIREFMFNELLKLEPISRELVILKFFHNLTYEEISSILNISLRTLKYKMKDILLKLNEKFKNAGIY